jgi:hypothetical protein
MTTPKPDDLMTTEIRLAVVRAQVRTEMLEERLEAVRTDHEQRLRELERARFPLKHIGAASALIGVVIAGIALWQQH